MKKLLSISLALAIIFILLAGIAVAGQIRDGTAPVFAQHSISTSFPSLAIHTSPAITISPQSVGIVIATGNQPAFAKGSSLKFMTIPLIEVIHPLLCYNELDWERMPLIAASKGPVNQTTGMASC